MAPCEWYKEQNVSKSKSNCRLGSSPYYHLSGGSAMVELSVCKQGTHILKQNLLSHLSRYLLTFTTPKSSSSFIFEPNTHAIRSILPHFIKCFQEDNGLESETLSWLISLSLSSPTSFTYSHCLLSWAENSPRFQMHVIDEQEVEKENQSLLLLVVCSE